MPESGKILCNSARGLMRHVVSADQIALVKVFSGAKGAL